MKDKKKLVQMLKNMKAPDQPRKKEKFFYPPGMRARKFGQFTFIVLFSFMLLVFLVTAFIPEPESAAKVEKEPDNLAAGVEAAEFAKKFADVYFTWEPNTKAWEARRLTLAPMLAKGLDEQAGVIEAKQEWSSDLIQARVLKVEEVSSDRALITLEVEQRLKKEKDTKTAKMHFRVPVGYTDGFAVYDLPSFAAVPKTADVERAMLEGGPVPAEKEQNIKNFLPTFFQSYSTDGADKLSYFLEGELVQGLEGSLEFVEVREVGMAAGEGDAVEVQAAVVMKEPQTGSSYLTHYRLTVKEQGGRYVVTKLNEGVKEE